MKQARDYVDLHVNGHAGIDFLSARTPDDIRKATRSLKSIGVKGFLASLITSELSYLRRAASLINEVAQSQGDDEAKVLGLHLEGPCLAKEKRGVHPENLLRDPSLEVIEELVAINGVKMITLAPELPRGIEATKQIAEAGIVISLGHTTVDRKLAEKAFDAGAKTVTHLYNGMEKDGELVKLVLERKDIYIQMIIDDVHVSRELVKQTCDVALDRLIITTDALAAAGLGPGKYPFGDMEIEIKEGKALRLDGRLAGGIGTPEKALQILLEMGYPLEKSLPAATSRPLELINAAL